MPFAGDILVGGRTETGRGMERQQRTWTGETIRKHSVDKLAHTWCVACEIEEGVAFFTHPQQSFRLKNDSRNYFPTSGCCDVLYTVDL